MGRGGTFKRTIGAFGGGIEKDMAWNLLFTCLPIFSHCGKLLDHDSSLLQVRVSFPTRMYPLEHSIVATVPSGEAAQLPCVESSTVNPGHSTENIDF